MSLSQAYLTHLLRYVGVGLISGSIVHAGTLGGNWWRYLVLIGLGAAMFGWGVWLEHHAEKQVNLGVYTALSILISIGTGMVSGATQHYLDGPRMAAILLPVGLVIGYWAFAFRDYRAQLGVKRVVGLVVLVATIMAVLWSIAIYLGEQVPHGH